MKCWQIIESPIAPLVTTIFFRPKLKHVLVLQIKLQTTFETVSILVIRPIKQVSVDTLYYLFYFLPQLYVEKNNKIPGV